MRVVTKMGLSKSMPVEKKKKSGIQKGQVQKNGIRQPALLVCPESKGNQLKT